jgi:citrate synthase
MAADTVHKGLAGVVVDTSAVSMVNPDTNSLTYRGYAVQDLAAHRSFEEVAYLLWHGELPTAEQLAAQNEVERANRALRDDLVATLLALPSSAHPMDVMRTGVSILGAWDPSEGELTEPALLDKSLRLFAVLPAMVALTQRRIRGEQPVAPRDDLGYAENFLYMTLGEVPEEEVVRAFEVSLVLYAEHTFNASTFTARVVASTLSDLYSAVTAAIGALRGPLHGGANEAVMATFAEIGSAAEAPAWLDKALAEKRKVMGFGHRVYKRGDSRVPTMRAALQRVADVRDGAHLVEMYESLAGAMMAAKGLHPNLDYPAGPAYHLMGFETPVFTPIFVASRITGWTAHVIEQLADNSLIRPTSQYTGHPQRELPPD